MRHSVGDHQSGGRENSRSTPIFHSGMSFQVRSMTHITQARNIQLPDEARALIIVQLQTLSGVAKGLTRATESLFFDEPEDQADAEIMAKTRDEPRISKVREELFNAISATFDLWSTDASVSDVSRHNVKGPL